MVKKKAMLERVFVYVDELRARDTWLGHEVERLGAEVAQLCVWRMETEKRVEAVDGLCFEVGKLQGRIAELEDIVSGMGVRLGAENVRLKAALLAAEERIAAVEKQNVAVSDGLGGFVPRVRTEAKYKQEAPAEMDRVLGEKNVLLEERIAALEVSLRAAEKRLPELEDLVSVQGRRLGALGAHNVRLKAALLAWFERGVR